MSPRIVGLYYWEIYCLAAARTWCLIQQHLRIEVSIVIAAIIVGLLLDIPDSRFEVAALLVIPVAILGVLGIVLFITELVMGPAAKDKDFKQRLARFGDNPFGITTGPPVIHKAEGRVWILIPEVRIINRSEMDRSIDLGFTITPTEGVKRIVSPDATSVPAVETSLDVHSGISPVLLANPVDIGARNRRVGYCALLVWTDTAPFISVDKLKEITVMITDGVTHVLLLEDEVWPSIYPELERVNTAAEQQ